MNGAEEYRTFGGIFGNQSLATDLLLRETQERNEWIDEQLGQALAQQQNSTNSTSTTGTTAQDHYVSIGYWPKGAGGFGTSGYKSIVTIRRDTPLRTPRFIGGSDCLVLQLEAQKTT